MKNKKTNKPLYALFYYDRRKLKLLLAFNLIVLAALVVFGKNIFYPQIPAGLLVILLWFFSTLASAHVCFFPQKLAIVTDEEIKIDDNAPLKWKNIAEANEIFAGPGRRRRIIALRPVERLQMPSHFHAAHMPAFAIYGFFNSALRHDRRGRRKNPRDCRGAHGVQRPDTDGTKR